MEKTFKNIPLEIKNFRGLVIKKGNYGIVETGINPWAHRYAWEFRAKNKRFNHEKFRKLLTKYDWPTQATALSFGQNYVITHYYYFNVQYNNKNSKDNNKEICTALGFAERLNLYRMRTNIDLSVVESYRIIDAFSIIQDNGLGLSIYSKGSVEGSYFAKIMEFNSEAENLRNKLIKKIKIEMLGL